MPGPNEWPPPGLVEVCATARALGFLGSAPVEEHLHHALGFALGWSGATPPERAADLGTGGGIPGLALACLWPATELLFVESNQRRSRFLRDACRRLGLRRAQVASERAEVVGRSPGWRGRVDLVSARGFGPPAVTAECAAPLLRVGGVLVVSEPPGGDPETRWPPEVELLGLAVVRLVRRAHSYVVLEQRAACPERYPRRTGIPAKRPLF